MLPHSQMEKMNGTVSLDPLCTVNQCAFLWSQRNSLSWIMLLFPVIYNLTHMATSPPSFWLCVFSKFFINKIISCIFFWDLIFLLPFEGWFMHRWLWFTRFHWCRAFICINITLMSQGPVKTEKPHRNVNRKLIWLIITALKEGGTYPVKSKLLGIE